MAIARNVLFLASAAGSTTPPSPDGIYVSNGTAAGTFEAVSLAPIGGLYPTAITSATALTYATLLGIGATLFATDSTTGLPVALDVTAPSPEYPYTVGSPFSSPPAQLTSLGAVAVFSALDETGTDTALWRTDGTAAGTYKILTAPAFASVHPAGLTRLGHVVVFEGYGTVFATDGTAAGTTPILTSAAGVQQFQAVGIVAGRLVFGLTSGSYVSSIWVTDGTSAGTRQISAAESIATAGAIAPSGSLIFSERNAAQLFSTDGSTVTAVTSAPSYGVQGDESDLVSTPTGLYFLSTGYGPGGGSLTSLGLTDGTAAGTRIVPVPSAPGSTLYNHNAGPALLTPFGNQLLFSDGDAASLDQKSGLWITDGTAAGTTQLLAGINPQSITVDANRAFVAAASGLYVTDGTVAGTQLVSSSAPLATSGVILDPTRVAVTGTRTQYALSPTGAGALQIADLVPNRDGSASYAGAAVVAFGDGTGVLDPTGNAQALARVYEAAYGRVPDIGGLIAYTEALDGGTATLAQIASGAASSPEFLSDFGSLSDAAFVAQLYRNADGRAPDPGGLAAYAQALASGQSRGTVLLAIGESYEARQHSLGVAGSANDAAVYRLYEAVDGRPPDPGGQDAYSTALASGQTVQQVAAAFLAAPEYAARFGTPDDATFVAELYENLLHRAPDAGGLAAYTASLASGTSRAAVASTFVTGDEGRLVTAPATHDGWVFVP